MSDERRPNPPGWVPPRAPYNPYDPTDLRPPEGYPSEFQAPGKKRNWTMVPTEPTNYRVVKDTLKRMQYTPRPHSEVYPGQYKVLRRAGPTNFQTGVKFASKLATGLILFVGIFFYRWNDGYENIFSAPYRLQLRMRERLFGNLTEQQKRDLEGVRYRGITKIGSGNNPTLPNQVTEDDSIAMERPQRTHIIEAERIRQEREEAILRAVDIAEAELAAIAPGTKSGAPNKKRFGFF